MKKHDIFISYQHTLINKNDCVPIAHALYGFLKDNGYSVFFDLMENSDWEKALQESKIAILLVGEQFEYSVYRQSPSENYQKEVNTIINKYKENKLPVVLVKLDIEGKFVDTSARTQQSKDMNVIISRLEEITKTNGIQPALKWTHLRYKHNFEDIRTDMEKILEKVRDKIGKGKKTKKKNILHGFLIGFLIALVAGFVWNYFFRHTETIVFAGGSTVANYLKENYGIDVNNSGDNSTKYIYIHMPSESASVILQEDKEVMPGSDNYYYPVVLSSEKLSEDSVFIEMAKKFMENEKISKKIVEYELGKADLVVCVKDNTFSEKNHGNTLSLDSLKSYLKQCQEDSIEIFTTSEGSGTLKCYRNKLLEVDSTFILPANDLKISNLSEDCRFVILGNRYYPDSKFIKSLKGLGLTPYKIYKDSDEQSVPLYIYTIAHKSNEENFDFELGKPLRSLFERLGTPIIEENWYKWHVNSCPFLLPKIPTK